MNWPHVIEIITPAWRRLVIRSVAARPLATLIRSSLQTDGPAYQSLAESIRRLIADGRLLDGTRLPSERELTTALGVSRTTVAAAYARLREQGYLLSRRGAGSVVQLPGNRVSAGPLSPEPSADVIDLSIAAPPAVPGLAALYESALQRLPLAAQGSGYAPWGLGELRQAIADRYVQRGLPTEPEQILVTSGALSAMSVVFHALAGPGDRVMVESPTYPNALAAVRASGARPVGVLGVSERLDPDAVELTLRQQSPGLAYLILDFHNPTGALADEPTRARLARATARQRCQVIADESLVELDLATPDERPIVAYGAYDRTSIAVGSLSKAVWGGLRIGWIRVPPRDLTAVRRTLLSLELGAATLEQLVAVEAFSRFDVLVAERRASQRASRDALVTALHDLRPDWGFTVPRGGTSLWCNLPAPRGSELCQAAFEHGVRLAPGASFGVDGGLESWVRIPYTLPPDTLRTAVERLGTAWDSMIGRPARAAEPPALIA